MTFRQIECFVEAGNNLNFTRTAEKLLIPQPAVSKNIAALEKELQVKLFFRDKNHTLHLTKEGSIYHQFFSQFYMDFRTIRERTSQTLSPLKFGYHSGWDLSAILRDVIWACRMENPKFSIQIESYEPSELEERLLDKSLDAVLMIDRYPVNASRVQSEKITDIQQCIIYSDHLYPPPKGAVLSPSDLSAYPIYVVETKKLAHVEELIKSICASFQFAPVIKIVPNTETVIANVDNGTGIAFYDELSRFINHARIHSLPVDRQHSISLRWLKNQKSQALTIFKKILINRMNTTRKG